MEVRCVTLDDLETWRVLRLRALSTDPHAFGSTYAETAARGDEAWRSWITNIVGLIAFAGEEPVGMAGVLRDHEDESVAELTSMWVDPAGRGTGAGDALIQEAVRWAGSLGAAALRLHVVEGNRPAMALYERNGFALTGRQISRERDGATELEMQRDVG